jgi:hypothetical protein
MKYTRTIGSRGPFVPGSSFVIGMPRRTEHNDSWADQCPDGCHVVQRNFGPQIRRISDDRLIESRGYHASGRLHVHMIGSMESANDITTCLGYHDAAGKRVAERSTRKKVPNKDGYVYVGERATYWVNGGGQRSIDNYNDHGKRDGLEERYTNTGACIKRIHWKDGKKHGNEEHFSKRAAVCTKAIAWKNGKRDGANTEWLVNGDFKVRREYTEGKKVRERKYTKGNLVSDKTF